MRNGNCHTSAPSLRVDARDDKNDANQDDNTNPFNMTNIAAIRTRFRGGLYAIILGCLPLLSCGEESISEDSDTTQQTANVNTTPPFTIDVIPGFHVEEDVTMVGRSYHYRPDDLSNKTDELGVYAGNLPDTTSPHTYNAKREYRDSFYGDSANWREFIMADYTFREVVVAKDSANKVHSWCYSKDSVMLEELTKMMKSIRKR